MGVKGLWGVLEPAQEITTLATLADNHFRSSPNVRGFRLGVDAPLWVFHANESVGKMDVRRVGPHAALRTLFFRLCALLRKGVLSVFVFDGPGGPLWKRGRDTGHSKGTVTRLERAFTALLSRMGIDWRKAPGEAEAELANMAKAGLIDAVLTDDGDALIFGAPKILRNSPSLLSGYKRSSAATHPVYTSSVASSSQTRTPTSAIAPTPAGHPSKHAVTSYSLRRIRTRLAFTDEDLLLIALLSGADYNPTGLPGLGVTHTVVLVSHGFAAQLLRGLHDLRFRTDTERAAFLGEWREAVARVLERDVEGLMGSKQVGLARMVRQAKGFPDLRVIEAYLKPVVTPRRDLQSPKWNGEPDMNRIVRWCVDQLMWTEEETANHLRNLLWKGLAMRQLRLSALAIDRHVPRSLAPGTSSVLARLDAAAAVSRRPERITTRTMIVAVHESKKADSTEGVASYRVELNPTVFEGMINPHFEMLDIAVVQSTPPTSTRVDSVSKAAAATAMFWPAVEDRVGTSTARQSKRTGPCHWFSRSFLDLGRNEVREMVEAWEAGIERKGDVRPGAGPKKAGPTFYRPSENSIIGEATSRPFAWTRRKGGQRLTSQPELSDNNQDQAGVFAGPSVLDISAIGSGDEGYLPSRLSLEGTTPAKAKPKSRPGPTATPFRPDKRPRFETPPSTVSRQVGTQPVLVLDDSDEDEGQSVERAGPTARARKGGCETKGRRASGAVDVEVVDLTGG